MSLNFLMATCNIRNSATLKKYEEEGKLELVEKTKMYIELLKGVLEKYNDSKRTV